MKPFNLERALAGDPVITRDGKLVNLSKFHIHSKFLTGSTSEFSNPVIEYSWYSNGKFYYSYKDDHELDLFMATKNVKRWIWVSNKKYNMNYSCTNAYESLDELNDALENFSEEIANGQIIEIEVDE